MKRISKWDIIGVAAWSALWIWFFLALFEAVMA